MSSGIFCSVIKLPELPFGIPEALSQEPEVTLSLQTHIDLVEPVFQNEGKEPFSSLRCFSC